MRFSLPRADRRDRHVNVLLADDHAMFRQNLHLQPAFRHFTWRCFRFPACLSSTASGHTRDPEARYYDDPVDDAEDSC